MMNNENDNIETKFENCIRWTLLITGAQNNRIQHNDWEKTEMEVFVSVKVPLFGESLT